MATAMKGTEEVPRREMTPQPTRTWPPLFTSAVTLVLLWAAFNLLDTLLHFHFLVTGERHNVARDSLRPLGMHAPGYATVREALKARAALGPGARGEWLVVSTDSTEVRHYIEAQLDVAWFPENVDVVGPGGVSLVAPRHRYAFAPSPVPPPHGAWRMAGRGRSYTLHERTSAP